MTTIARGERVDTSWPLASRLAAGFVQPGGPRMVDRLIEGAAIDEGSRIVELAPGLGLTSAALLAVGPRSWTGVEPDDFAAARLRGHLAGAGRDVVVRPLDATGLDEGSASAVVADGLLGTLSVGARAAVIAEGARLLRAGGRLALHDVTASGDAEAARRDLAGVGIALLSVEQWRGALEDAGLVIVGSLTGSLDPPAQHELIREAGPRTAMGVARRLAAKGASPARALAARSALERHGPAMRSVVVVAEMPLILGMRRPRR